MEDEDQPCAGVGTARPEWTVQGPLLAARRLPRDRDYVADGEWIDPEWLARAARKATRCTLVEGAAKTLDLKLAPTL